MRRNRDPRTGRWAPAPLLPAFNDEAVAVVEPPIQPKAAGQGNTNAEFQHGAGIRKAVLIDAESGAKLDSGIVEVTQPDQVNGGPVPPRLRYVSDNGNRLLSSGGFGHLDTAGDDN